MEPLNVYIAADFARIQDAEAAAARCGAAGARIISTWHRAAQPAEAAAAGRIGGPPLPRARQAAARNVKELSDADIVIVLTTGQAARGGRHFETGYAYAMGKQIVVVGPSEHAFHQLPGIEHCDEDQLEEVLRADRTDRR